MRTVIHWIVDLAVMVCIAWFAVYSFFNQVIISGHSMAPVLEVGDMCLVNRLCYDVGKPQRFDIVVFERADSGQHNIKRIIGLPGETVQIVSNSVYINNHRLYDENAVTITNAGIAENPVVLAKDEYFLIGDNEASSEDSRFANIGNVKRKNIRGRLWFKLRPLSGLGFLH